MSSATLSAVITKTYKDNNGTATITSEIVVADNAIDIERAGLAIGASDVEFDVSFGFAALKCFGMGCSKTKGEVTTATTKLLVKINSVNAPLTDQFTLTATNGAGWSQGDPSPNPFTADVQKLYVSNLGSGKADFYFRGLLKSTPGEVD